MGKFNRGASTNLIHIVSDCFFCFVAFLISGLFIKNLDDLNFKPYVLTCLIYLVVYILCSKDSRLYNITTFFYVDRILRYVTKSFFIATGVTSTALFYIGNTSIYKEFYIAFIISSYVLFIVSAFVSRYIVKHAFRQAPRTLLIGDYENFKLFQRFLRKSNFEINFIGFVSLEKNNNERYLGSIDNLENIIHMNGIDQVYIMNEKDQELNLQPYINMCMEMGVTARIIMNKYSAGVAQSYVSCVGTYPVITYHRVSLNASSRALKRAIDIIGSIVGIVLSSPFMLLVALAIKLDSPGPIIFKQCRVGLNGRQFNMYKFRSMCSDAEKLKKGLMTQNEASNSCIFKITDDPRITKVGKIIRKTSLDELPQFFNVLIGNMSLVGTRPPTLDEVENYERSHWRRMSIKPGITGMWQVSGRSTITDFDDIVELDTEYIDGWNVFMDMRIMLKTIFQVILRRGAC